MEQSPSQPPRYKSRRKPEKPPDIVESRRYTPLGKKLHTIAESFRETRT